jgi:hypothetical protein
MAVFHGWTALLPEMQALVRALSPQSSAHLLGMTCTSEQAEFAVRRTRTPPLLDTLAMDGDACLLARFPSPYRAPYGLAPEMPGERWHRLLHTALANGHWATVQQLRSVLDFGEVSTCCIDVCIVHARWWIFERVTAQYVARGLRLHPRAAAFMPLFKEAHLAARYLDYCTSMNYKPDARFDLWAHAIAVNNLSTMGGIIRDLGY